MKALIFLLFILQIFVSSEEDTGMVPPDGSDVATEEEGVDSEEFVGEDSSEEIVGDDDGLEGYEEGDFGDEFEDFEEFELGEDALDFLENYDIDLDDFTEEELAALMAGLEDDFDAYDDGYGEVALGEEYEDAAVYIDGEEHDVDGFEYEIAYDPEDWEAAEDEWEFPESFDLDISEGDLLSIDYCEHFTAAEDGAMKMNPERCEEVESAFCDCEVRPDFYYTPEQCLMLKYQFSFDYLMQDCCLDESVENNLCSDYMEALALCECHPDEGECTEDEMMEDCDYLWDETMHMCRNITADPNWPICEKEDLRTELRL